MIEQTVILADESDGVLTLRHFQMKSGCDDTEIPFIPSDPSPLLAYEKYIIMNTMKICGGNKNKVAAILGIKRQTLYNKLRKFEIA